MIKLINYEIAGPRRVQIRVTDGITTQTVMGVEVSDSDYRTIREFYAYGKRWLLVSELEYREGEGTCCVARVIPA